MRKREEITNKSSCFNKAQAEEPIFILRAQDQFAAQLVRLWAKTLRDNAGPEDKVISALTLANDMDQWPVKKIPD